MPADYPDYPQWWQVRDYLRRYAEFYGLYDRISFRTAVTWAKPEGVGWSVTLTNGEFQYYSGIIAAPGTAWFPARCRTGPGRSSFRGQIWHSARYKSPGDLAGRRVLVVGAGNSAADIACDAARAGAVDVPVGTPRTPDPAALRATAYRPMRCSPACFSPATNRCRRPSRGELVAAAVGDVRALGPAAARIRTCSRATRPSATTCCRSWPRAGSRPAARSSRCFPDGVRFVDGTMEQVDLIIAATGYEPQVPFLAPELYTRDGNPDLFMNIFSRSHDGLALLGLSDFGGPTFPRFDDQARAVMVDITLRELGGVDWRAWRSAHAPPGRTCAAAAQFADSPASALTVDDHTYSTRLRDLCDRFGYTPGGAWAGTPPEAVPQQRPRRRAAGRALGAMNGRTPSKRIPYRRDAFLTRGRRGLGEGRRVDVQLAGGRIPYPLEKLLAGDHSLVHGDLHGQPVDQRDEAPRRAGRIVAGEVAVLDPERDHVGEGVLPAQVEAAGDLLQLGYAHRLGPAVDPHRPRLRGARWARTSCRIFRSFSSGGQVVGEDRLEAVEVLLGGPGEGLREERSLVSKW